MASIIEVRKKANASIRSTWIARNPTANIRTAMIEVMSSKAIRTISFKINNN
jgi:hypothetical protein